jgi:hypothetical protein
MELMRHSTAEMTLATYAQAVGEEKREAGKKVASLVLEKREKRRNGPRLDPDRIFASYWTQILLVSN